MLPSETPLLAALPTPSPPMRPIPEPPEPSEGEPNDLTADFALPPPTPLRLVVPRLGGAAEPATNAPGAEATGAVTPPRPLAGATNPRPAYPEASQARREQGQVQLRLAIDAAGRVIDIVVQRSAGYTALDEAALAAVRRWRFEPALRGGRPVPASMTLGVTFQIAGERNW